MLVHAGNVDLDPYALGSHNYIIVCFPTQHVSYFFLFPCLILHLLDGAARNFETELPIPARRKPPILPPVPTPIPIPIAAPDEL